MRKHYKKTNYNKYPKIDIDGFNEDSFRGYRTIWSEILEESTANTCIVIDCYLGVNTNEIIDSFVKYLKPQTIINSENIFYNGSTLNQIEKPFLTTDRARGIMYRGTIDTFIDKKS